MRGPTPVPATSTPPRRTRISSVKSSDAASLSSVSSIPRSSAIAGALTRLTGSSVCPERIPTSTAIPSRRVSCSAIRPWKATSTRSMAPSPRPWARRPSLSHSGTNGASASIASGRTAAMLTAFVTTPPVSAASHLLGGDDPGPVLRLGGRGAQVRGDDDVVALEQRVLGERLRREDVERAPRRPSPDSSPSRSASRSISSPRAQLTIRTPSRICAIASASIQPTVSGVFGRWIVIRSARR